MAHNYLTFNFQNEALAIICKDMEEVMKVLSLICTLRDASDIKVINTLKTAIVAYTFEEFIQYSK